MFKPLEPPPGGAERFARRLDDTASPASAPRWRNAALAGAACAAAALVVAAVLLRGPSDPALPGAGAEPTVEVYGAPEFDRLLGRSSQATELMVTVNAEPISVTEIATQNEKVRIYRIN
jgi:hypothetical protein